MALLVTGGGGFVMSNLAVSWLDRRRDEEVVVLDAGPPDPALERFFAPVAGRLHYVHGSVLDRGVLDRIAKAHAITRVVHGATVTLFAPQTLDGAAIRDPESEMPAAMLEVNVMGAVTVLDWARTLPGLERFINVSSGAVYNDFGPEPPGPMPEDGWVDPPEFYGISKRATEMIGQRYATLFGMSVASCRLSGVYGPMDRSRPSRVHYCAPYVAVHRALAGRPIRVSDPDAVGDHIHAGDVAAAIMSLLDKEGPLDHAVYNIALGRAVTVRELIEAVACAIPGAAWRRAEPGECDIALDAGLSAGRWGAYDITRIAEETGWRPRPLEQALADYVRFVQTFGPTA